MRAFRKGRYSIMSIWEYVMGGVMLLFSIAIVIVIILQEGHQQGIGVVTGGADTFFSKNKARSIDTFLAVSYTHLTLPTIA